MAKQTSSTEPDQLSLFVFGHQQCFTAAQNDTLSICTWNLQSASEQRLARQLNYLVCQQFDILVLTELRGPQNIRTAMSLLADFGYGFVGPGPDLQNKQYATLIAAKEFPIAASSIAISSVLANRLQIATVRSGVGDICLVGGYFPTHSHFSTAADISVKHEFHRAFFDVLSHVTENEMVVLIGDLNLLEPDHQPRVPCFKIWEADYCAITDAGLTDVFSKAFPDPKLASWVSKDGMHRWRLDHAFVSQKCLKLLESRKFHDDADARALSDHLPLSVRLRLA